MRALLMAGLMASLLGCPAAEEDRATTDDVALMGDLHFEGEDTFSITVGDEVDLSVRLLGTNGAPITEQEVEFGLTGSPEGASLSLARVATDSDGVATTTLYAGRAAAPFRVRASADGLKPLYFNISVGAAAAAPSVTITIEYGGLRMIKTNSVVIVEGMTCDQLRNNATDIRMSRTLDKDEQLMFSPAAGRSYAIAAWASDESNSKLAFGCTKYDAPLTPSDVGQTVPVTLEDIVFTATAPIPVSFTVNLQPLLATLAPLARSAVMDTLPKTSTPQASFLLDLIQAKVDIANARKNDGLDAALQQLLDAANSGALRFADAHVAAVGQDGAMCTLQGSLTPVGEMGRSALALAPPVYAVPSDSLAKEVSPNDVPLKGVSEFDASYSPERALVTINSLKVGLGFGSYAAYMSKVFADQSNRSAVVASTGCIELRALLTQRPASFAGITADDADKACQEGVNTLVSGIRGRWSALDAERNTIAMSGTLSVHDRDGDKKIDDLGPAELSGGWANVGTTKQDPELKISVRMSPTAASAR
jgi:hypothetical protein